MKKFKKRLTVCLTGFAGGDFITAKKRKRRYSGGAVVAGIVKGGLGGGKAPGGFLLFFNLKTKPGGGDHPHAYEE